MSAATPEDANDYDPFANRDVPKPVSNFGSMTNLIKSSIGTAMFAMPNAFACVGLINGIIGTCLIGLLVTVTTHFMLIAHHTLCVRLKTPTLMYDKLSIASVTESPAKSWVSLTVTTIIVDIALLTCYIGIGSVYVVFVFGIIQEGFGFEIPSGPNYSTFVMFPFFLLMNMMKHLKEIAPLSMAGNLLLIGSAMIGIVYCLKDGLEDTWVYFVPSIDKYPSFIGTVIFSLSSPGVILAIDHSMKYPWNFAKTCGILNWGMVIIVVIHIFVGTIGYFKWGPDSLPNFIRNHRENDIPTFMALVMQASAIYLSYGLQCYTPIAFSLTKYVMPRLEDGTLKGSPAVWDFIVRLTMTLITCVLAVFIPKLDLFMGLVGCVSLSLLSIFFPLIMYTLLYYGNYGKCKWRLILVCVIFVAGSICSVSGFIMNVTALKEYLIG